MRRIVLECAGENVGVRMWCEGESGMREGEWGKRGRRGVE